MRCCEKDHPVFGKCLFADNGIIEVGIPLEFGLRIGHFSLCGGKNVFYEQPREMTLFCTEKGWRLRGGHRLWIAPEAERTYYPDNDPISYEWSGDELILTQNEDPWLSGRKQFVLTMEENRLRIRHRFTYTGKEPIRISLWSISVMAPGGTETIDFESREGGMDHWHRISMWDYTSLGDPRATYTKDQIVLRSLPSDSKYKIGVGHPKGPVRYENEGIRFIKHFTLEPQKEYPDANVSYETFLSPYMVEMESLSPLCDVKCKDTLEHTEILELQSL